MAGLVLDQFLSMEFNSIGRPRSVVGVEESTKAALATMRVLSFATVVVLVVSGNSGHVDLSFGSELPGRRPANVRPVPRTKGNLPSLYERRLSTSKPMAFQSLAGLFPAPVAVCGLTRYRGVQPGQVTSCGTVPRPSSWGFPFSAVELSLGEVQWHDFEPEIPVFKGLFRTGFPPVANTNVTETDPAKLLLDQGTELQSDPPGWLGLTALESPLKCPEVSSQVVENRARLAVETPCSF